MSGHTSIQGNHMVGDEGHFPKEKSSDTVTCDKCGHRFPWLNTLWTQGDITGNFCYPCLNELAGLTEEPMKTETVTKTGFEARVSFEGKLYRVTGYTIPGENPVMKTIERILVNENELDDVVMVQPAQANRLRLNTDFINSVTTYMRR